jgi:hypothetical protein
VSFRAPVRDLVAPADDVSPRSLASQDDSE